MRPNVTSLSAACASALLVACAGLGQSGRPPLAGLSADDAYVLARQQHLAYRLPAAIDGYQAALRADPHHLNASNGLATLYAEQGNLPKAIGIWRALTVDAPDSAAIAFIHSNLGYAYLLNGDFELAIAALERACLLDPLNHRAWRHLGDALARSGQDERAARMHKQADTFEQHDLRGDFALTGATPLAALAGDASAPTPAPAATLAVGAAASLPAAELRQTGAAMFALLRPAPAAARQRPPPPLANRPPEQVIEPRARLEIRNGNGVGGMARALSAAIADQRTGVVWLSNQQGFKVARTRVEFQPGFEAAAGRLAERFDAELVPAASAGRIDLRLVLGRDLARSKSDARRVIRAALQRLDRAG